MDKKSAFSLLFGSAIVLTGCSKKMNQFAADYFSTNPNPLEVVGGMFPLPLPVTFLRNSS